MKDRATILSENPLLEECERRGMVFERVVGGEHYAKCCFHEDQKPSFRVNVSKQTWFCDPCGCGGSVIDLISRLENISISDALKRLSGMEPFPRHQNARYTPENRSNGHVANGSKAIGREVAAYDYTDADGNPVFQVVRFEPKDFRQRRKVKGEWTWNLNGVVKPLYNLPKFKDAPFIWIVEGEKDADALNRLGLVATCNAGGAKKWEEQYSEQLRDKEVILCGDNDAPGREHTKLIEESIKGIVRSLRTISVPLPHKDVSEYLATFDKPAQGMSLLLEIASEAEPLYRGSKVPVLSMSEMEKRYQEFATQAHRFSLNLGHWLPSLSSCVRPLVPGELVCLVMDTGVGKTMALQNIAITCHLPTLLFEMELPDTLTFERFCSMALKKRGGDVFNTYSAKEKLNWKAEKQLDNISVCVESRLTPTDIERIIQGAAIKTGAKPVVVMVDYIQLLRGSTKSRYENMSLVAEELKIIAKATQTIIIIASQVNRTCDGEPGLHDAKDSGSIENSSGLVLSAWRDSDDKNTMLIKVCKNTKGSAGKIIRCHIHDDMRITELAQKSDHVI